tara:strand:+ start:259 stop:462 length:204 start_codon:yes stop_codon:yes gene_type:complete
MIGAEMFTLLCQDCGREIPLDNAVWGQEYPEQPGSPSVPFCNSSHRARYVREFKAEKAKFMKSLGVG